MFKDPQFLMTFQLAFNGIVLIVGLFFVWKGLTRVEEKIDMVLLEQQNKSLAPFKLQLDNSGIHMNNVPSNECIDQMMDNDSRMCKLFGSEPEEKEDILNNTEFVMFTTPFTVPDGGDHEETPNNIQEITTKVEDVRETAPSEVSDIHGPISRNKLRHLNLEKLRHLCEERGISSEGTKNTLIERILQSS